MTALQREREARGWSRAELARRSDLNAGTVGLIESGRFVPYPVQLQKIAKALGIDERRSNALLENVAITARKGSE